MDELALMDAPEPSGARESGALMMEQVATTTEKLVRQRDWDELAKEQIENIFRWTTQPSHVTCTRLSYSPHHPPFVEPTSRPTDRPTNQRLNPTLPTSAQSDVNDMDLRRLVDNVYTLGGL